MKYFLVCCFTALLIASCSGNDSTGNSDNEMDAVRNFVRAALDGDYELAERYLAKDSLNQQDLNAIRRMSEHFTPDEKKGYKGANIRIHENRKVNDSTFIVEYSNSFTNKKDSLRVIRDGGKWMVDFKYIFKHKTDSL